MYNLRISRGWLACQAGKKKTFKPTRLDACILIELAVCVFILQQFLWLFNRRPCLYSRELQRSREAVYGSNNVCPSAACGDRRTALVSDSAQAFRQNCESSQPPCHSERLTPSLPDTPKDKKMSFCVLDPPFTSFIPSFLPWSVLYTPSSNNHVSFHCLFSPPPGLIKTRQGDSKSQQYKERILLLLPVHVSTLCQTNAATKYYHHLLYFHNWIFLWPDRPRPLLLKSYCSFSISMALLFILLLVYTHTESRCCCASFIHNVPPSYTEICTKCVVNGLSSTKTSYVLDTSA